MKRKAQSKRCELSLVTRTRFCLSKTRISSFSNVLSAFHFLSHCVCFKCHRCHRVPLCLRVDNFKTWQLKQTQSRWSAVSVEAHSALCGWFMLKKKEQYLKTMENTNDENDGDDDCNCDNDDYGQEEKEKWFRMQLPVILIAIWMCLAATFGAELAVGFSCSAELCLS